MGLATFSIDLNSDGTGGVVVNGEKIDPSALSLHAKAGQPPVLQLQLVGAHGPVEGEGIVQVQLNGNATQEAVKQFLANVSPGELDERVCEKMEWSSDSPMALALEALEEMVGQCQ